MKPRKVRTWPRARQDVTEPVEPAWRAPMRRYAPVALIFCLLVLLAMALYVPPHGRLGLWSPWQLLCLGLVYLGLATLALYLAAVINRLEVAERRHAADAQVLTLTKERLDAALNHIEDGVISTDVDGNITVMNQKAGELTGWTVHDAIGRPLEEVFRVHTHGPELDESSHTVLIFQKGRELASEKSGTLQPQGGAERAVHYRKLPVLDEEGWLVGVILVIHDVTELRAAERQREKLIQELSEANARLEAENIRREEGRRAALNLMQDAQRAQTALREREEHLRLLFDGINDVLLVHTDDGRILDCNDAACHHLGYERNELLQRLMRDVQLWDDEQWQSQCYKTKTDRHFPVDVQATIITYHGEEATLSVARDIAELTRIQNELKESNERLLESNAALEEYARVASHDLQEPLRKIESFAQVILEDYAPKIDKDGRHYLNIMSSAARRMRRLIKDVLTLSRVAADPPAVDPVDLGEVVTVVKDTLSERLRERSARIVAGALPTIYGDRTQMIQLFQNLVGNGLKFNESKKPKIEIKAEENHADWRVSVRDNGIGMNPDEARYIFAPFKRLHGQGTYEGTGIGLAICRKIVIRHGGDIMVESKPGKGSTFVMTFPKKKPTSWLADQGKIEQAVTTEEQA